jgi:hypothetical protein
MVFCELDALWKWSENNLLDQVHCWKLTLNIAFKVGSRHLCRSGKQSVQQLGAQVAY